jgi:hypothetical protein
LTLGLQGLSPAEYAAKTIKKTLVGSGAAEKQQIMQMLGFLMPGIKITNQDASDAVAIAVCHSRFIRPTYWSLEYSQFLRIETVSSGCFSTSSLTCLIRLTLRLSSGIDRSINSSSWSLFCFHQRRLLLGFLGSYAQLLLVSLDHHFLQAYAFQVIVK